MATWRYEISLLVLKKISHFSSLKEKLRISVRPCNILYISISQSVNKFNAQGMSDHFTE